MEPITDSKPTLLRELNERVSEAFARFGSVDEAAFFCECPLRSCDRRFELTPAAYDDLVARGGRLLAPDCPYAAGRAPAGAA